MAIFLDNTILTTRDHGLLATERKLIETFNPEDIPAGMQFNTCQLQCGRTMPRFADEIGVDGLKNDFDAFFQPIPSNANTVPTILNVKTGVETPLDASLGVPNFLTSPVFAYTFKISWFKVWQVLGYGTYQIKIKAIHLVSSAVLVDFESVCYEFKKYSDSAANGTVRIETIQEGILKHGNNYKNLIAVGGEIIQWCQQWRVYGALMLSGLPRENDRLQDTSRSSIIIKDQINIEYDLRIKRIEFDQVDAIIFDGMFANRVKVVDYNVLNFDNFKEILLYNQSIETGEVTKDRKRKTFIFKMIIDKQNIFRTNN